MFRIPAFAFFLLLALSVYSQNFSISIGSGVGTYQMKDLKNLNHIILVNSPAQARIVNNFPVTPIYSVKALIHLKRLEAGINYIFNSTGSRIHYADYSGELSAIQVINSNQASILIYPVLFSKGKNELSALFRNSVLFSKYSLKQELTVWDESASDQIKLISESLGVSVGLAYSIKFRPIELRAEAEYLFDFGGTLFMEGNRDFELHDNHNEPIKTNWSGLRLCLYAGWYF